MSVLTIGVSGGSGSGKTLIVQKVAEQLYPLSVCYISQDAYYYDNSHLSLDERRTKNFDQPEAIDFNLLCEHIQNLKNGSEIEQPVYSFLDCIRLPQKVRIKPAEIILVDGILIFTHIKLLNLMDLKIFIDADPDVRLSRIINRDTKGRGKTEEAVKQRYFATVHPMHQLFIEPSKKYADVIIKNESENEVVVNEISSLIIKRLQL
jgi:uridine kinase